MIKKQHSEQLHQAGFSHVILPIIILVIIVAVGGFAYSRVSKNTDNNTPNNSDQAAKDQAALEAKLAGGGDDLLDQWKTQCTGKGPVTMKHTPMDIADVSLIHPIGLLAAAHVTPIDHLYFYSKGTTKRDANPVYAMADGFIVDDDLSERGQTLQDGKLDSGAIRIVVQHNCTFYSYYDLMTSLDPGIASKLKAGDKHIAIKAGQVIGRVGGQSLDTAIYNLELTLPGFINPGTYSAEPSKIHTDDFFKYFSGKDLSDMLALNPRKVQPYGGKVDYDIAGKLRGNWFEVGTNGYGGPKNLARTNTIGDTGYFSGHLSIAPDAVYTDLVNVSFGSYEGKPQQFTTKSASPDPATVGEANGMVKYELTPYKQPTLSARSADTTVKGTVLFQVIDGGKKLKMEAFPGKTAGQVSAFTNAAKTFER